MVARRWLGGALVMVLVAASCVLLGAPAAQAMDVSCQGNDTVFAVQPNGNLWDYENRAPGTGQFNWQSAGLVGSGFTGRVLAGNQNDVFYIQPNGDLRQYFYFGGQWGPGSGVTIGNGFGRYVTNPNLITADATTFYAVDAAGNLRRYQYNQTGGIGTGFWTNGAGDILGTGWNKYRMIAESNEALYAVDFQGNVFRYSNFQQPIPWVGHQVASGWTNYSALASPGGDILYALDGSSGNLYWYHVNADNGTFDNYGQPQLIGAGFTSGTFPQLTANPQDCSSTGTTSNGDVRCAATATVLDARPTGDLWEYTQTQPGGRGFTWSNSQQIGGGFVPRIIGGPNDAIYLITAAGDLRLYAHDDIRGWTNGGGTLIGGGFQRYAANPNLITSDGFGHLFVVDATGALRSYRYDTITGAWDNAAGTVLATGWDRYRLIFATDDNQIYAIDSQNNVFWYSYDSSTGQWAQYAKPVATGWQYSAVFSPGGGLFYAIDGASGNMYSLQFNELLGTWSAPSAPLVGDGWNTSAHPDVTAVTNACAAPFAAPVTPTATNPVSCAATIDMFDTRANGDLWLYQHTPPAATTSAYTALPVQIGTGFTGHTLGGANGDIFTIAPNGDLRLYHFDGTRLTNGGAYQTIAQGWGTYVSGPARGQITVDPANDIYTVDANGVLRMFHYNETTGAWDNPNGTVLAQNWSGYSQLAAPAPGVLYASDPSVGTFRFQYDSASQRWLEYGDGITGGPIGSAGPHFSPGGDVVYGIDTDGTMSWYQDQQINQSTRQWVRSQVDVGWVPALHQDVTASMDGCTVPAPPAVAPVTPLAARSGAPIALAGDGRTQDAPAMSLHYFYRDAAGHVIAATDSGATGLATQQIGTRTFVSDVSAVTSHDMAVAAIDANGQVWLSRSVTDPVPDFQPLGGSMRAIAMYAYVDQLQIFGLDADGNLWTRSDAGPSGGNGAAFTGSDAGLTAWYEIRLGEKLTGLLATDDLGTLYATDANGNTVAVTPRYVPPPVATVWDVQVCVGAGQDAELVGASTGKAALRSRTTGQLSVQNAPASGSTSCGAPTALTNPTPAADLPVAFTQLGGRYRQGLATTGTDGTVYLAYGGIPGTSTWTAVGVQPAAGAPALAAGIQFVAGDPTTVDVVYRGQDGKIYHYQAQENLNSQPPLTFTGGPHS